MLDVMSEGQRFVGDGKYELLAPAGEGAMGTVYVARHVVLERIVAVKLLHDDVLSRPGAHERFLREARAASSLRHKNMVWALDYGVDAAAGHFFVMEYIEGQNLSDVLAEEGKLEPGRALFIAAQILGGLAEAHDMGIVHRDIKASNVMLVPLTDDDGEEREHVKVFDFGIASIQDSGASEVAGTPEYMSPEQIGGLEVDPRSDIYSVGVLLYAMLTGTVPFARATPRETMLAHLEEAPLPFKERGVELSRELEHVVMRSLSKSPGKRYISARKFRASLIALREFTEKLEPTEPRARKASRRRLLTTDVRDLEAAVAQIVPASPVAEPQREAPPEIGPPAAPLPESVVTAAMAAPVLVPKTRNQGADAMSCADTITKLIKQLASNTPDVEASAVIDNDGLMIASALGRDVDDEAVAAMSAALLGIGERIVRELKRGDFEMVMTRGSDGYIILVRCGRDAVLSVLTSSGAKIGLVFLDVKRAATEIAKLLG